MIDRATEIERSNLNLFNKMRAIIRTKHTDWRHKMQNPTTANLAPRDRERVKSAMSNGSAQNRSVSRPGRQGSARSSRSVTLSQGGDSS